MVKCVIFDMDGTIADTQALYVTALRKSIDTIFEAGLTDQEVEEAFSYSGMEEFSSSMSEPFEKWMRQYLRYYEQLHPTLCPEPYDGIAELLSLIKNKGCRLALVTGKDSRSLEITLRFFGMEDTFDAVESGSPEDYNKPEGIRRVLKHLQVVPQEAVYIGDVFSDITAARSSWVPIISAAWSEYADSEFLEKHHPDQICHTVGEAAECLRTVL